MTTVRLTIPGFIWAVSIVEPTYAELERVMRKEEWEHQVRADPLFAPVADITDDDPTVEMAMRLEALCTTSLENANEGSNPEMVTAAIKVREAARELLREAKERA